MISVPTGVRLWLATWNTDMRKGFASLAVIVQETLKRDPNAGHLFVFRGRRGQRPTFRIRFPLRDDRVSVASACGAPGAGGPFRRGKELKCIFTDERPDLCRELPDWMFDAAYCAGMELGSPAISLAGLKRLADVLAALQATHAPGASCPPLSEKETDDAQDPTPTPSRAACADAGHAARARAPGLRSRLGWQAEVFRLNHSDDTRPMR